MKLEVIDIHYRYTIQEATAATLKTDKAGKFIGSLFKMETISQKLQLPRFGV